MRRETFEGAGQALSAVKLRGVGARGLASEKGQAFLRELIGVLDGMDEKRLAYGWLRCRGGGRADYCAVSKVLFSRGIGLGFRLGALGAARELGLPVGIVRRVIDVNDDEADETPEVRHGMVRRWALACLRPELRP